MLKIIKQGKKESNEKKTLKFKCMFCKCVFKTDEYATFEYRRVNARGQRVKHSTYCPCCKEYIDKWE